MAKFASSEDPGFDRALGDLMRWKGETEEEIVADQEQQYNQALEDGGHHNIDYGQISYNVSGANNTGRGSKLMDPYGNES